MEEKKESTDNIERTGTLRFVALGDAGEGNEAQYKVADAMENLCAEKGCDFAIYLGDNFYNSGVESVDDSQFQDKFELPYAGLDFPFYVVLGNHDYGAEGAGNVWDKPDPQVAYSDISEKWNMPDRYHTHTAAHARFFGIDTNAIMWNNIWGGKEEQAAWINEGLSSSNKLWNFAYGHHPYISNGQHGSAGLYDGIEGVPILSGLDIKEFVEEQICGKVDVYFSGHDHNLEWLEPSCGTEFIISGAGAKDRERYGWGVPDRFGAFGIHGFMHVEVIDATFTGTFYDSDGVELYSETFTKE